MSGFSELFLQVRYAERNAEEINGIASHAKYLGGKIREDVFLLEDPFTLQ